MNLVKKHKRAAKLVKNRQMFNNWSIAMRNYIQIRFYELLKDVISSQQTGQDYPHEFRKMMLVYVVKLV